MVTSLSSVTRKMKVGGGGGDAWTHLKHINSSNNTDWSDVVMTSLFFPKQIYVAGVGFANFFCEAALMY